MNDIPIRPTPADSRGGAVDFIHLDNSIHEGMMEICKTLLTNLMI